MDDETQDPTPGNWYEEMLWDLAGGPFSLGPMILGWIALLGITAGTLALTTGLTEKSFMLIGPVASGIYFSVVCPIWARRLGRRRDGGS